MSVSTSGGFRQLDPKLLREAQENSLSTVGILLEGEVISRANENVDTGRHKGSVTWKTVSAGSDIQPDSSGKVWPGDEQSEPQGPDEVHIGTNVEYAPHLEYGHRTKGGGFVPAYPHFRRAFDENKQRVSDLFTKAFRSFVKHGTYHR